jgi:hypothetical protein
VGRVFETNRTRQSDVVGFEDSTHL